MRRFTATTVIALSILLFDSICSAQQASTTAIPNLIRYSGTLKDAQGGVPSLTTVGLTFAIYKEQDGGAPVWQETHNVTPDANGQYSIVLGSATAPGLPDDLFSQQEQRWLGVQVQGQAEQQRVLLVSVPYAFKAHEAETLGGLPASAFVKAPATDASSSIGTGTANASTAGVTALATSTATAAKAKATPVNNGLPNYIGKFVNTTDLVDSALYEIGGKVGISTTSPIISLDVRTGALPQMGIAGVHDYLTFFASDTFGPAIYWGDTQNSNLDLRFGPSRLNNGLSNGLYDPFDFKESMRIQSSTGNVGIGTATPSTKLEVNGEITADLRYDITSSKIPVLSIDNGIPNPADGNLFVGIGAGAGAGVANNKGIKTNGLQPACSVTPTNTTYVGTNAGGGPNNCGNENTFTGSSSGANNTTGSDNTFNGYNAGLGNVTGSLNSCFGEAACLHNLTGTQNVSVGVGAGFRNTNGNSNVYVGFDSGWGNQGIGPSGSNNTMTGWESGFNNTADGNSFYGYASGYNNTTGIQNVFSGYQSGLANTTGISNVMIGYDAGQANATGSFNTLLGTNAGAISTAGGNTCLGYSACSNTGTGFGIVATGYDAGRSNTTGTLNAYFGVNAGFNGNIGQATTGTNNTYLGNGAGSSAGLAAGSNNVFVGFAAGNNEADVSNNIEIGNSGPAPGCIGTCSNTILIGTIGQQNSTFVAGIYGSAAGLNTNQEVCVDSNGKLWGTTGTCATSSRRFKDHILDMGDSSSKLFDLRPVTFFYKSQYDDGSHLQQYGLIAEEVAKVYPDMVVYDKDNQPYTVKYQLLAPMLLNEVQKQHTLATTQQDVVKAQQEQIQTQAQQIQDLQHRLARMETLLENQVRDR